jgi:hypothetical protein
MDPRCANSRTRVTSRASDQCNPILKARVAGSEPRQTKRTPKSWQRAAFQLPKLDAALVGRQLLLGIGSSRRTPKLLKQKPEKEGLQILNGLGLLPVTGAIEIEALLGKDLEHGIETMLIIAGIGTQPIMRQILI